MKPSPASDACHISPSVFGEQFVADHVFSFLEEGTIYVFEDKKEHVFQAGSYLFIRRNTLSKYRKVAPLHGAFKTVTVYFNQQFLKRVSEDYRIHSAKDKSKQAIRKLNTHSLLENFVRSYAPYRELEDPQKDSLLDVKRRELLLLLLKTNPELESVLFDFSEPGKIDLKAFMNRNFTFNISLERFSYLTGRSLTTFKRDFEKLFNQPPGRWLVEKRLEHAHYRITKKNQNPSDVYLQVGFQDLSHFSFAFKKHYGFSPNQMKKGKVSDYDNG